MEGESEGGEESVGADTASLDLTSLRSRDEVRAAAVSMLEEDVGVE